MHSKFVDVDFKSFVHLSCAETQMYSDFLIKSFGDRHVTEHGPFTQYFFSKQ